MELAGSCYEGSNGKVEEGALRSRGNSAFATPTDSELKTFTHTVCRLAIIWMRYVSGIV